MPEPRIDPDFADISFRDRGRAVTRRHATASLFWVGVSIFIGTLLAYPFYSYKVESYLAARDLQRAVNEMDRQMGEVIAGVKRETESAARRSAADQQSQRLGGVSITGTTVLSGRPLVIVDLGRASLAEARPIICRLAALHFGRSLSGERIRVQIQRGTSPATDAGSIDCT